MKEFVALMLLGMSFAASAESLPRDVVAAYIANVQFAPPERRGEHKMLFLSSGDVQKVDNKNKVTLMAKLSPKLIKNLIALNDQIKSDELTQPTSPACTDAPSLRTVVQQTNGKIIVVWRRINCRDSNATDAAANEVSEIVRNFSRALYSLDK